VRAEQVEGIPAGAGDVVEELPGRAAGFAAEHVVTAAAEYDSGRRVGVLDRVIEVSSCSTYSAAVPDHSRSVLPGSLLHCQ
jgi:hypothetical protein